MTEGIEVIVIGGGYAGVMAANRLTRREEVSVTLVNPRPVFVERPRPHQLVGGSHEAVVDYREVLGEGVVLTVDTARGLHIGGRPGARLKEFALGYGRTLLVNEARRPGSHTWPKDNTRRRLLRAEPGGSAADAEPAGSARRADGKRGPNVSDHAADAATASPASTTSATRRS